MNLRDPFLMRRDPLTGMETWGRFNADGTFDHWHSQDVQGITDANAEARALHRPGSLIGNTQRHVQKVAEIPMAFYLAWKKELGGGPDKNPEGWARKLNDPEFRAFRTTEGRVNAGA